VDDEVRHNRILASLKIIPLVVVNQGFGASLDVDACRVIDASFLKLFLGSSTYYQKWCLRARRREHGL
jgi:hypothetical protein